MNIPEGMKARITVIYPTQDEAVKAGKELVADGCMFTKKGLYYKGILEYQVGYDDTIHEVMSKVDLLDIVKSKKKARRKGIKV